MMGYMEFKFSIGDSGIQVKIGNIKKKDALKYLDSIIEMLNIESIVVKVDAYFCGFYEKGIPLRHKVGVLE